MLLGDVTLTKMRFNRMVEDTVLAHRFSYIDAVVYLCEKNSIEVEDVKKYISDPVKDKIAAEAMRLNYLPRGNELPFE